VDHRKDGKKRCFGGGASSEGGRKSPGSFVKKLFFRRGQCALCATKVGGPGFCRAHGVSTKRRNLWSDKKSEVVRMQNNGGEAVERLDRNRTRDAIVALGVGAKMNGGGCWPGSLKHGGGGPFRWREYFERTGGGNL